MYIYKEIKYMSWIKIEERLPKLHEYVLVVEYASDNGWVGLIKGCYIRIASLRDINGSKWSVVGSDDLPRIAENGYAKVTHWMPLPEPPNM